MLDKTGSVGTLTTPLIRATTPGFSDSIAFEYSLSDDEGNVLNVFMVELHNVPRLLWTSEKQNNSSTGHSNYLKGDVTVSSSTAFQIQFTGKRETASSVVAIRNVHYIRKTTPLASEPPADQGHSNAGATTGGVIVAVLIVLAIAIGGFIFWRRRNKQRDHQETDPHNSPDTATPLPHADEQIVSPENYERLNAVSEQREYAVLQATARQPTDSTYYELPSGEGPAVAGTTGRNSNDQNFPVPENGLSDTANAGSAEGGDGSNTDYLTPVLTMPAAVDTASK
ncbi:uncharacterized protein [Littorina saxatilis]|uniref:uncharacterized protein n=1 Tax=Littorina saxatilis TaxID=31220 RepID=UPI0038B4BC75